MSKQASSPIRNLEDFRERFLAKCKLVDGCLIWCGAISSKGYGNVRIPRWLQPTLGCQWMTAHRVSVYLFRGILLGDSQGHHCCVDFGAKFNARDCVDPWHIEGLDDDEHRAIHNYPNELPACGEWIW